MLFLVNVVVNKWSKCDKFPIKLDLQLYNRLEECLLCDGQVVDCDIGCSLNFLHYGFSFKSLCKLDGGAIHFVSPMLPLCRIKAIILPRTMTKQCNHYVYTATWRHYTSHQVDCLSCAWREVLPNVTLRCCFFIRVLLGDLHNHGLRFLLGEVVQYMCSANSKLRHMSNLLVLCHTNFDFSLYCSEDLNQEHVSCILCCKSDECLVFSEF